MNIAPILASLILGAAFPAGPLLSAGERPVLQGAGPLRAAVLDLLATFGDRYVNGDGYLARLDALERRASRASGEELERCRSDLDSLRREALAANPLVCGRPILFVVRLQYAPDHHSTETMFQTGEINSEKFAGPGALKILDLGRGGAVETLLTVREGVARDPEVSFDGKRIVFSLRRSRDDDYHVYEMESDGSGLRQLTFGRGVSDIDPEYLSDGSIAFSSTRDHKFCHCNRHIMANLFRMDPDGANIHQIGRNILFEGHPHALPDGTILYDRWEYVDRHFGPSFGLWTVNPDGTNHSLFYGNNSWSPGMIADARMVPGTGLFAATFGSCHDRPWGAIALVDRSRGLDGTFPIVRSWPPDLGPYISDTDATDVSPGRSSRIDAFAALPAKYEDPYPLSEKHFLASRRVRGEEMGIYLLDVFGNEVLLHFEPPGCFDPMPLAPRPRPPELPSRMDPAKDEGLFYIADVYRGTGMEGVPRGSIRYLRVVEATKKVFWTHPYWIVDATQAPAMNWNLTNGKRILGDVPVEEDGSAYFAVPANTFIYFQALDGEKLMVQSMRSGTMARPGELTGCAGCHENRLTTVPAGAKPGKAMARTPSRLEPWHGAPRAGFETPPSDRDRARRRQARSADAGDTTESIVEEARRSISPSQPVESRRGFETSSRDFNYLTEVQPVFDRLCVPCHDFGKPAGEVLNLAGDVGLVFNVSYLELHRKSAVRWSPKKPGEKKPLITAVHDGPPQVLPPCAWGSHGSRLVDVLRAPHHDVKIEAEDLERIVAWIDLNAPYYGSYASAYPGNLFGRSPLDDGQLRRLSELTGISDFQRAEVERGSLVSFARPDLSPILSAFKEKDTPRALEALSIIRAGKEALGRVPREDMLGPLARPVASIDLERDGRQKGQARFEERVRDAQGKGKKIYTFEPTASYAIREVEGFKVLVNRRLLEDDAETGGRAIVLLGVKLFDVRRAVPPAAFERLRKVPIWLEADDRGIPCATYHPSREWLSEHGYNPEKGGAVEIGSAKTFLAWTAEQPSMILHELAHAYHFQVLGEGNGEILAAFRHAREKDLYGSVLYFTGEKRRAYALTDEKEYFAELSEAYFGANDFYPFVRAELREHDPEGFRVIENLWGK